MQSVLFCSSWMCSRRYINLCNSDVFSVVNVYLDHLKFCVVCINGCFSPSETYGTKGGDYSSLHNCQFHHRRLESLEHLIVVLFPYIILVV